MDNHKILIIHNISNVVYNPNLTNQPPSVLELKKIQRSHWIFLPFLGSFFGGAKKNKTLTKIANRQWFITNAQKVHQPGNTLNRNPNPYLYPTFEHYLHTPCYPQPPKVIYNPNLKNQPPSVRKLKKSSGAIGFLTRLPVS